MLCGTQHRVPPDCVAVVVKSRFRCNLVVRQSTRQSPTMCLIPWCRSGEERRGRLASCHHNENQFSPVPTQPKNKHIGGTHYTRINLGRLYGCRDAMAADPNMDFQIVGGNLAAHPARTTPAINLADSRLSVTLPSAKTYSNSIFS